MNTLTTTSDRELPRIGWIGYHQEGLLALRTLLQRGVPVVGVVTLKPEAAAKRCALADYLSICREFDVPYHQIANINDPDALAILREMKLDLAFVLGWSQILNGEALGTARLGMIGAHASLLPHNRGSAPVNWAIIHGESETGNSLIWLSEEVDAGEIIDQRRFPITPYDTCASIYERVAESNRDMVLVALARIMAGERPGRTQHAWNEPILPRRRPQDGLIQWQQSSQQVYDFIRALTRPYPGAFGQLAGQRWKIWRAAMLPDNLRSDGQPGEVLGPVYCPDDHCCGQLVACGAGQLILLEVEDPSGRILQGRALSNQAWQRKVWKHAA